MIDKQTIKIIRSSQKSQRSQSNDPYSELEKYSLHSLKYERDRLEKELQSSFEELNKLKEDFQCSAERTKKREQELRDYINTLRTKLQQRDVGQIKEATGNLQLDIVRNIQTINSVSLDDIISKKKDIQTRLGLRLVEFEYRHQNVLATKFNSQKEILRLAHEYNQEMDKVVQNYLKVKNKAESYVKENEGYRILIKELKSKNSKIKNNIKHVKHQMTQFFLKKDNHHQVKSNKSRSVDIKLRNTFNDYRNDQEKERKLMNMEDIIQLLDDKSFIKTNTRHLETVSSLAKLYEVSKMKLIKLRSQIEENVNSNDLSSKVGDMIAEFKISQQAKESVHTRSDRMHIGSNGLCRTKQNEFSREERMKFIEYLTFDSGISNLIYNERYPNILNSERKLVLD